MNIYEKHLEAIEKIGSTQYSQFGKSSYNILQSAKACEAITKEAMKEFGEYLCKTTTGTHYYKESGWQWVDDDGNYKSTEQLLEEFLNLPQ